MAIFQNAGGGYRDASKAMSIKALQSRMKAAQEAAAQAQQVQNPLPDVTSGIAHLAGVAAAGLGQSQAENAEAAGRQQLAQTMAGINQDTGPTPEQMAQIYSSDPDMGAKMYEQAMRAREAAKAQEDAQAHALELQGGQQTFTAGESDKDRTFQTSQKAADYAHQDTAAEKLVTTGRDTDVLKDTIEDENVAEAARIAEEKAKADSERKMAEENASADHYGPMKTGAELGMEGAAGDMLFQQNTKTQQWDQVGGKGTNVTTNVGAGGKLDETLDVEEGKIWGGHQKERNVAAGSQKDMAMLGELSTQVPNGPIMGNLATVPILKNFSNAGQAFNSIVQRVAPTLRVEGSGSTSDIEYQGMLNSLPALGNYPEANQLIIGMMQAKSAINIERGNIVDSYRNGEISVVQARQKLAEVNQRSIMNPELDALMQRVTGGGSAEAPAGGGGSADIDAMIEEANR